MNALLSVILLLISAGSALAQAEPAERFAQANAAFDHGVALLGTNEQAATQTLRSAAIAYESLFEEIPNSDLATDAGNARLLAGDVGEAIAHYHQALRLDPADPHARKNLAVARQRVRASAVIESTPSLLERAMGWRLAIPAPTRVRIGAAAWALVWLWAAARLAGFTRLRWTVGALPAGAVALVVGSTLLADVLVIHGPAVGVVTARETTGRTGPDAEVYEPSFTKPLPEGVEFRVVEERAGWVLGALGDGRESWVPASDVTVVGG